MNIEHDLPTPGEFIPLERLTVPRAVALAAYLQEKRHPHATLLECRVMQAAAFGALIADVLLVEVEVEVPSQPVVAILHRERFAVFLSTQDDAGPLVLPMRRDFPEAVHMNPKHPQFGRTLCLTEIPWEHNRLSWTPYTFIKELRRWLARTSRGENHLPDQDLEPPFLAERYHLVLPADHFQHTPQNAAPLALYAISPNVWALADTPPPGHKVKEDVVCLQLPGVTQVHGAIDSVPTDFSELQQLLLGRGVDLTALLRERITAWNEPKWYQRQLLLLLTYSLKRSEAAETDPPKVWAVLCDQGIGKIGEALGIWAWDNSSKRYGVLFGASLPAGAPVGITIFATHHRLTPTQAAAYSGKNENPVRVTAIGAGALGSQVMNLMIRSGYGTWTIVDYDTIMPHNLARHALTDAAVGIPKAIALRLTLGAIGRFADPSFLVENALAPHSAELIAAMTASEAILDFSASVPVARALVSEQHINARRASFFMDPSGASSMLICEGVGRSIPLDVLEMQLYNQARSVPKILALLTAQPRQVPYAGSCREQSFQIPNEHVALHAAIGAGAIPHALDRSTPSICAWHIDPETMATEHLAFQVSPSHLISVNGWRLSIDDSVLSMMANQRRDRLQNETGGVLIGAVDGYHRRVYVVDMIPSPPDSQERRTSYIRGVAGLRERVEAIAQATEGRLNYLGEWHSHPDGYATCPSKDDGNVFEWLKETRAVDGLPTLMAIIGELDSRWFIDTLAQHAAISANVPHHA